MKAYEQPILSVLYLNDADILTTSDPFGSDPFTDGDQVI